MSEAIITVQNVKTYSVPTEIREDIKASIIHLLKSDKEFVKEIFSSVEIEKDTIQEIVMSALKTEFHLPIEKETSLKKISKEKAKKQIQEYVENNAGCKTSDIILELELDPLQVTEILKELQKEQKLDGTNI